ncbi:MAG: tetratricopeptide repeat protein, partial [Pseudomonadota bacterium]
NYLRPLIALVVVLIVLVAFFVFHKPWKKGQGKNKAFNASYQSEQTIKKPASQEAFKPVPFSLAVLSAPKTNDSKNQNFTHGLAAVVAGQLAAIPELRVISSRSTSLAMKSKVDRISWARTYRIEYILETDLNFEEDKAKGILNIFSLTKNSIIHSSTFDVDASELWKLPNLFVSSALMTLRKEGLETVRENLSGKTPYPPTGNAYKIFLEAVGNVETPSKKGNETAIGKLVEVTQADPEFAQALAELAKAYISEVTHQWTDTPRKSLEKAYELSTKALHLNDSLSIPYQVISFVNVQKRQYREAIQNARKAIELSPGSSEALESIGMALTFAGQGKEAIPYLEKAISLDPETSARCLVILGHAHLEAGDYSGSVHAFRKALDMEPNSPFILSFLAASYALSDQMTEARATAQELMKVAPSFNPDNLRKRLPFKDPAQIARIIDSLNRIGLTRSDP